MTDVAPWIAPSIAAVGVLVALRAQVIARQASAAALRTNRLSAVTDFLVAAGEFRSACDAKAARGEVGSREDPSPGPLLARLDALRLYADQRQHSVLDAAAQRARDICDEPIDSRGLAMGALAAGVRNWTRDRDDQALRELVRRRDNSPTATAAAN